MVGVIIDITTLVCSVLAVIVSSWCAWMVWKLADRVVSKLDTHIIEVVEEPVQLADGDRFSQPAQTFPAVSRHVLPPDGLTHAQREERTLRRGVPGWPGPRVHGA